MKVDPDERCATGASMTEARCGSSHGDMGWKGLGTGNDKYKPKEDEVVVTTLKNEKTAFEAPAKEGHWCALRKKKVVLEATGKGEGIQVEIRDDSRTVVDWVNGMARQRSAWDAGDIRRQLREWWGRTATLRRMTGRCTSFVNKTRKLMLGRKKEGR